MKKVIEYLQALTDERRGPVLKFHTEHEALIVRAKGSLLKHQAWPGGYLDHLGEIFRIAEAMWQAFSGLRPLSINFDSVILVLYFHDIEKMWKYTDGLPVDFDKDMFLFQTLKERHGIEFSPDEKNALIYIHGEPHDEYSATERIMGPLAAFCHAADTLSARFWHDEGQGHG